VDISAVCWEKYQCDLLSSWLSGKFLKRFFTLHEHIALCFQFYAINKFIIIIIIIIVIIIARYFIIAQNKTAWIIHARTV